MKNCFLLNEILMIFALKKIFMNKFVDKMKLQMKYIFNKSIVIYSLSWDTESALKRFIFLYLKYKFTPQAIT